MKHKITILFILITSVLVLSSFTHKYRFYQDPKKVSQDTLNKNVTIADSLGLISNLTLTLHKKNAHASYYHNKFNGRRTASGTKFDNSKYTAAHRKFPFGTKLKVTNEANKKSVIVTVTDRGPFSKGREIDLTRKAFMDIAANKNAGNLKVTIEVIK
ncbi:septal ring lytic transglycosylase RlpA family protein [Flavobacterium sp.]|uniref:septal ring lytic transglycosylase RlpA family protein n=1 Tax=Flavobacterium sp. TaxID=239 RepID=UPI00260B8F96|nr:septal ring lytic transglycosylase RlpA family protein [Flavobacterium sp.]MDD3005432.1 septal ring lytic transglycosylase RlpA family protein [Flavobacterium sp.]